MSIGSPPVPYHIPMQSQQPPCSDSPNHNNSILPNHLKSPLHSTDSFGIGATNTNTNHAMYNSMNNIHLPSDYAPLSSTEPDALNLTSKANGFGVAPIRSSVSFNPFPRSRHNTVPTAPFRDASSAFNTNGFQIQSTDMFGVQNGQQPSSFGYDGVHHPGRVLDYPPMASQSQPGVGNIGASSAKQQPFSLDGYRQGLESTLIPNQQGNQPSSLSAAMSLHQQGPQQPFHNSFTNGISHGFSHGHHGTLPSHSQFTTTLPANGPGSGPTAGAQGNSLTSASGVSHVNGNTQTQQQEEISTIFVVGFPEDMQEREFQNMFTFSSGFEAATLKIPNKEYNAYGTTGPAGPNRMQYPGSNDPYNLVTVNQGGVVVDGGRDGTTTSWPAAPVQNEDGHFMPSNLPVQPPRKQIIGFAKFRTRQEAIEARDILQGRRVDVERGAVLKAEMAKKNLHTKRGPGAPGMPLNSLINGSGVPSEALSNYGLNGLAGLGSNSLSGGEALAQRERELGALGAMGIGLTQRRDRLLDGRDEEERDRRRADLASASMGLNILGTRGARERAEEDERERERKRKEKEAARLRQNSSAFEAFHSVPQQMVRQGANSLLSAESGTFPSGGTLPSPPSIQSIPSQGDAPGFTNPWTSLRDVGASAAMRKMSIPALSSNLPPRPISPQQSPPTSFPSSNEAVSAPLSATSQNGNGTTSAPFSPPFNSSSLPSHPSLPSRPRPLSPHEEQLEQLVDAPQATSVPMSSASSVSGSENSIAEDLARSVDSLVVSTNQGTTSPQLPSPSSGTSSGAGRNPGDQNPPINTLYVGNLPTTPAAGGLPLNYLEDRLRELFSRRPGYRKLCFRQKSNGPMCFVEFEDVEHATKTLNELYGHTLNGLVRGGIRLSYSKNPLGVRTPTSANGQSLQQQQQSFGQSFNEALARHGDMDAGQSMRRDTSVVTSPTSSYHYTTSPPPPRFTSPFPLTTSTAFPRTNPQGYGLPSGVISSFSPFSISPSHSTIPDQPSADASNDTLTHGLSTTPNLEASRVG